MAAETTLGPKRKSVRFDFAGRSKPNHEQDDGGCSSPHPIPSFLIRQEEIHNTILDIFRNFIAITRIIILRIFLEIIDAPDKLVEIWTVITVLLFSYGILANIIVFGNALDAENKINEA
jgi:hypothetical protein